MEGKEDLQTSGVMRGDEVPDTYRFAARNEIPIQFTQSTTPVAPVSVLAPVPQPPAVAPQPSAPVAVQLPAQVAAQPPAQVAAQPPAPVVAQPHEMLAQLPTTAAMVALPSTPVSNATPGTDLKKRRGRPRKYGPDGKPAVALSPMPISASIPLTGEYSTWKPSRGRSVDSYKKKHKIDFGSPGDQVAYSVGANFTPHIITVNPGEDVTMKIISFSQQGSRAICILAGNGAISNVTLRQPNSCGGTLTYEGCFEILSLSGSFMPTDSGGTKSRTGGMSVSLAGPDGRVLGGGLAGLLVAAGPVQIVIGSFLPGHQQEQKPKKQKFEHATAFSPVPSNHLSEEGTVGICSGTRPNVTPVSYHGDNLGPGNPFHSSKVFGAEKNISLPGEPKDLSPSKCMVSC